MGNSPRRIYIYPPLQQDDDGAASPFWPPGTSGLVRLPEDQSPSASSGYSESNVGQGGGLLGMLLRGMQQERDQPRVDSGLAWDGAPEVQYADYDGPQSGLLGRRAAPQAEQSPYQPFAESDELPLSDPRNPNFRQLARIPVAGRPQAAIDSSNPPEAQSSPSYFPLGGGNSLDLLRGSRQQDQAAQPDRSFADRLQAYWNYPHPYGLVSTLKQALDGMARAVQGSIDATTVPSTEEQAFRQNLGRERGPIGAWQAASVLNPVVPGGTGGIFARPLVDAITNGLALRASEHTVAPSLGLAPGYGNYLPGLRNSAAANEIAAPQGVALPHPTQAAPRTMSGLLDTYGNKQALPWIPAAPSLQPGIDEIRAGRKRYKGPVPRNVSLLNWQPDKPAQTSSAENQGGNGRGSGNGNGGGNGGDYCVDRFNKEMDRCHQRRKDEEYADFGFQAACEEQAALRLASCLKNGGRPALDEVPEWGLPLEEVWRNLDR